MNNYLRLHVCLSVFSRVHGSVDLWVIVFLSIPAGLSKNVTNESCLVRLKNEKYISGVTHIPQGSIGHSRQPEGANLKVHEIKKFC